MFALPRTWVEDDREAHPLSFEKSHRSPATRTVRYEVPMLDCPMPLILILVILLLVFGGGGYYMGPGIGYYGGGGLSIVLLIIILFLLFGRGRRI
jgi:hypothetical protein